MLVLGGRRHLVQPLAPRARQEDAHRMRDEVVKRPSQALTQVEFIEETGHVGVLQTLIARAEPRVRHLQRRRSQDGRVG